MSENFLILVKKRSVKHHKLTGFGSEVTKKFLKSKIVGKKGRDGSFKVLKQNICNIVFARHSASDKLMHHRFDSIKHVRYMIKRMSDVCMKASDSLKTAG